MVAAFDSTPCPQCAQAVRLCLCAAVPCVASLTRLVLVINHRERRKPTNTGALAARCLSNSEVHVVGAQEAPIDYAKVAPRGTTSLLLFPGPGARPLDAAFAAGLQGGTRLIVPDGHWGQAAKMRRRLEAEAEGTILHVTLPPGEPTRYSIRREGRDVPGGLATIEAIARAYAALEGPAVSEPLLEIFRVLVERTLWARGRMPAADVYGGVPGV